jgi:hypothetical protein
MRDSLRTTGLLPSAIETSDQQKKRALAQLRSKSSPLEKYIFLAWLRNTNVRLFYRIVTSELEVNHYPDSILIFPELGFILIKKKILLIY